jgi:hypothetical protein
MELNLLNAKPNIYIEKYDLVCWVSVAKFMELRDCVMLCCVLLPASATGVPRHPIACCHKPSNVIYFFIKRAFAIRLFTWLALLDTGYWSSQGAVPENHTLHMCALPKQGVLRGTSSSSFFKFGRVWRDCQGRQR